MKGSPRRRGPPRRGNIRIGELEDKKWDLLVRLGKVVARLGEGRLCLSELAIVRGLCLWPVWGQSRGSVYDCCGLLLGPMVTCLSVSLLN